MTFDKDKILAMCNTMCKNTLMETLKIEFTNAGEDFLVATMPVNSGVHQPWDYYMAALVLPLQKV